MVFYMDGPYERLRFGDILKDFLTISITINDPVPELQKAKAKFEISADHYVLMSPCCSIEDNIIMLCPLIPIKPVYLKNPYFADDMTRINKKVPPEKRLPPDKWEKLSEENRQSMENKGPDFANVEVFIFPYHPSLPANDLEYKKQPYPDMPYMIDFRRIFSVKCDKIDREQKKIPVEAKVLELTPNARKCLRDKISFFFYRTAEEDLPFLE